MERVFLAEFLLGQEFFPLTRTRAHQGDRPWVTPKNRAWIRKRQIFLARYGKDSQSFKQWRNKVQRAIKSCKEAYYDSIVKNLKDTRVEKWWKEIKELSGVSERESVHSQPDDGANVTSVTKLCDCINDFFASLTAGFTPLSPSDVSDIHVDIEAIPPIFLSLCAKPTSPCGRDKSQESARTRWHTYYSTQGVRL